MTKLGLHTDLAAHALGCPAYERQTDAGAIVAPVELLEHAEDAELIKNAMNKLPAEFREILTLRHQENLSYTEIGRILKIPIGTVMSRLARARAKLREYLASQMSQEK